MRTIEYKVSYENMISRIPGLFAYLDSNALGEVSLHHAYDSNCGCYGKIVENIKLPVGTSLIVDEKVLLEEGKTYTFRTIITYYYQYRDLFTKYVYIKDETRVITVEEYKNLDIRKQNLYKRHIDSEFIKFVERGIGKIEIPFEKYNELINNSNLYISICKDSNVITKEEYNDLSEKERANYHLKRNENVPKFLYLANVISLYNELVKMGKQCMFYQNNKEKFGNDKHMCCLCERYINMGGDDLRDYVGSLIEEYKEISDEYFDYADNEKSMTLDFDIDLVSSYDDMGIMDSYITEWIPYKQYYKGDRVFYNGEIWHYQTDNTGYFYEDVAGSIWRCKEDNTGYFYEDALKVVFSDKYFEKINNVFEKVDNQELVNIEKNTFKITGQTDSKLKDLRRFVTYMNDDNIGEKPENGYDWLFYYRIGNICNISTLNDDLGNILKLDGKPTASKDDGDELMAYGDVITNIKANKAEEWIPYKQYYEGDRVFYDDSIWCCKVDNKESEFNADNFEKVEEIEGWMPNQEYSKGDRVFYKESIWRCTEDNTGQDVFSEEYFEKVEENTITFEYIINAHLIGNSASYSSKLDEDKNVIHYWKDFTPEENTGVKYTETYNYAEGSDLDKLIKGEFKLVPDYTEEGKAAIVIYLGKEKIVEEIEDWIPNKKYYKNDRVFYDNSIWRCTEDNTLFNKKYFEEVEEIEEWTPNKKYYKNDRVFYDNSIWRCTKNNTVQSEFNADNFEEIEKIKEWTTDKQYYKNDRVFYDGSIWRCIKNNTIQSVFNKKYFKEIKKEIFTFDDYVNGKYDDNLKSFKFEFITFNNELNYSKTIANQEVNITSILTDFEVFKNDNDEFMEVHSMNEENLNDKGISMYRHDYFNGITYAPTKKIDVYIERGSTSCFQQHIAFSEIKTINDMTEYRNNSFFKINEG